jgi:hypothetical protein
MKQITAVENPQSEPRLSQDHCSRPSRWERNFGTRMRDAKNHSSSVWRPVETKIKLDEIARKWPQKRLSCVFARGRRFPKTGWWRMQSGPNRSPTAEFPAVALVHRRICREAIEITVALRIPQPDAFAARQNDAERLVVLGAKARSAGSCQAQVCRSRTPSDPRPDHGRPSIPGTCSFKRLGSPDRYLHPARNDRDLAGSYFDVGRAESFRRDSWGSAYRMPGAWCGASR